MVESQARYHKAEGEKMTVHSGETTSRVAPIGFTITREAIPGFAKRLAEDLFHCTRGDIYKYLPDSSAKERFAETIGNYLHVILNQMGVDSRDCKHCGKSQQDHEWIGGYCGGGNGQKYEAAQ